MSAIVRSACVRPFVRSSVSSAGVVVQAPDQLLSRASSPPDCASLLAAVNLVRPRCAAGVPGDRCCARRDGQRSRNPVLRSGPAVGVVAGLVADQGVGDLVGALCHCSDALLPPVYMGETGPAALAGGGGSKPTTPCRTAQSATVADRSRRVTPTTRRSPAGSDQSKSTQVQRSSRGVCRIEPFTWI